MTNFLTVAAALTDSLLFRWFALLAVVCAFITLGLAAVRRILRWADAQIDQAVTAALTIDADDWDQHVAEAVALTETPTYDAMSREQFVADAMAEIETLTGGAL